MKISHAHFNACSTQIKLLLALVQNSEGLFKSYFEYFKLQADHGFRQKNIIQLHDGIAGIDFEPILLGCRSRTRYLSVMEEANRRLEEERAQAASAAQTALGQAIEPVVEANEELLWEGRESDGDNEAKA